MDGMLLRPAAAGAEADGPIARVLKIAVSATATGPALDFPRVTLAAVALACSTRLDTVPTLAVCSALFIAGLMGDYLFKAAADAGSLWAKTAYALIPNWQQFWLADALEDKKSIPWSYVAKAAVYMGSCIAAALAAGVWLFEDRELS